MRQLPRAEHDGLYVLEVGEWSRDKHHFLYRYMDAFTTAMRVKSWSGLHYIDLFAGSGIERIRGTGELEWGSPLLAAQIPHPFDGLHLCELNSTAYQALETRIARVAAGRRVQLLQGDANEKVQDIVRDIPRGTLSLAFLDPPGLHLHFDTLRVLARHRADLVIFFPDHLDALRNCQYVYEGDPNSNLDRVLGSEADWRSALKSSPQDGWAEVLRGLYVAQIRTLGYRHFEYERILMKQHPLYLLVFCSRHEAGAEIWRGTSQDKPDGQRTFDFG
jgi:three-Cys-motif partner protein